MTAKEIIARVFVGLLVLALAPVVPPVHAFLAAYPVRGWSAIALVVVVVLISTSVFRVRRPELRPEPEASRPKSPPAKRKPRRKAPPKLSYLEYTSDKIDDVHWRWTWRNGVPSDLWAACPTCDAQLVYAQDFYNEGTMLLCERCHPNRGLPPNTPGGPHDDIYAGGLSGTSGLKVITRLRGVDARYAQDAVKREIGRRLRTGERP